MIYALCFMPDVYSLPFLKKSGYKGSAGEVKGVTGMRSHAHTYMYIYLYIGLYIGFLWDYFCFWKVYLPGNHCLLKQLAGFSAFALRQVRFIFASFRSSSCTPCFFLLFLLLGLLHRLTHPKNLRKNWVVLINVLDAFEYQYNEHAVFNLNF